MNLQASLDAGMPPTIFPEQFDTDPPSNMDDRDLEITTEVLKTYPDNTITDTSMQRFFFKSFRPRFEMLRRMNGLQSDMTYDEVLDLSSEISNACREYSVYLKSSETFEGSTFKRNFADLLLRRFLLNLHRPWASRAQENRLFSFSKKINVDSAMALLSPMPDEHFDYLVLRGSGMFKHRMIHITLALASELLVETDECEDSLGVHRISSYTKMIANAVTEARSQALQRTQLGDTNVRLHMKLSIALCHMAGSEVGISRHQRIAQSAKDSLEISYTTIQAMSGLTADSPQSNLSCTNPQENGQYDFDIGLFDFDDILQTTDSVDYGTFGSGLDC
jgi:hypothetical protein